LGHLAAIKFALRSIEELIIAIGSAEKSHEIRNPFTAGERIEMVKNSLDVSKGIDVRKILIIPVPDTNVHYLWTYQLDAMVPKYKMVFTNDPFTSMFFREKGTNVIEPPLHRREVLFATGIRSRIAENREWKALVTPQTVEVIEDIHGILRIKAIHARSTVHA